MLRNEKRMCSTGPKYLLDACHAFHTPRPTPDEYQVNQAPHLPQLSPTRGFIHNLSVGVPRAIISALRYVNPSSRFHDSPLQACHFISVVFVFKPTLGMVFKTQLIL